MRCWRTRVGSVLSHCIENVARFAAARMAGNLQGQGMREPITYRTETENDDASTTAGNGPP